MKKLIRRLWRRNRKIQAGIVPLSDFESAVFAKAWEMVDRTGTAGSTHNVWVFMEEGGNGYLPGYYQVHLRIPAFKRMGV